MSKIPRNISSLVLRSTSVYEIEKLIHELQNKNSHSHDQIRNILLKELNLSISFPLNIIFNQSISEGKFPAAMKKAKVIPLYKGKDQDHAVNHRPISLLVTISKILGKIIYKCVYDFLEKERILYNSQYGFRSKHSCEQAILELTGKIQQAKEQNLESAALFLDLSKAFDILNHEVLLVKLERYGIRGICNDWFCSSLNNRTLTTKVQTSQNEITKSDSYDINYGTAQGFCLGPLLFILFTNDIYLLSTFSSIILFADNTTLFNSAKNTNFLQYSLEHDMSILMDWYKANKLSLNVDKTVLLKFWLRDKPFTINVEGTKIKNSQHTQFLGVLVDECLNWKEHMNNLYNKILNNKRLLSNSKNLLPKSCLLKIYHAHVYSHLIYGMNVWGTMCPKTLQNSLYRLQQDCLKISDNKNMKSAEESFKKHKII